MNAAGTAQPAPETITGVLKSSAVSGAAAVAMQKNSAGSPSASRLRIVLVRPSGLTTSIVASGTDPDAAEDALIAGPLVGGGCGGSAVTIQSRPTLWGIDAEHRVVGRARCVGATACGRCRRGTSASPSRAC